MTNPLLSDWNTPFDLPPFDLIDDSHFAPALDAALADARARIAAICGNTDAPDFANTIEALELADATLNRVLGAFYGMAGADSNPAREALQRDFAPIGDQNASNTHLLNLGQAQAMTTSG